MVDRDIAGSTEVIGVEMHVIAIVVTGLETTFVISRSPDSIGVHSVDDTGITEVNGIEIPVVIAVGITGLEETFVV